MERPQKITYFMYKLLIESKMDGFTITQLRDASFPIKGISSNLSVSRKKIYQKVRYYEEKKWLKSEGAGRSKRYFKTSLFKQMSFVPDIDYNAHDCYSILSQEYCNYKAELEIVNIEIDECYTLKRRFPQLEESLRVHIDRSRKRLMVLVGKINVLNNILNGKVGLK